MQDGGVEKKSFPPWPAGLLSLFHFSFPFVLKGSISLLNYIYRKLYLRRQARLGPCQMLLLSVILVVVNCNTNCESNPLPPLNHVKLTNKRLNILSFLPWIYYLNSLE